MPSVVEDRTTPAVKLRVAVDTQELARAAADIVADVLVAKPEATLVMPTGNTPLELYGELVRHATSGAVKLSPAKLVSLDEYAGLSPGDPRLLADWLRRALLEPAGVPLDSLAAFRSDAPDPAKESARMEAAVSDGIDLLVLGLGPNGHLGFNEPGSRFDSPTRLVELSPDSIRSNAAYWGDEGKVPRRGYTLGMRTLSKARRSLLLVTGEHKAGILARCLREPISPALPASMLRLMHSVTIIADRASAAKLVEACGRA